MKCFALLFPRKQERDSLNSARLHIGGQYGVIARIEACNSNRWTAGSFGPLCPRQLLTDEPRLEDRKRKPACVMADGPGCRGGAVAADVDRGMRLTDRFRPAENRVEVDQ